MQNFFEHRCFPFPQIIDLKKTNGERIVDGGIQAYRLYYQVFVKLNNRWYWKKLYQYGKLENSNISDDSKDWGDPDNAYRARYFGYTKTNKIQEGSIYVVKGTITFKKTEKGWVNVDDHESRAGYCEPNTTPEACIMKLGF
jgi:hypothetical protein